MRVYNQDEFREQEDLILKAITDGAVFIHPTDTIYGIGCDATNPEAVQRVREIKKQHNQPFSIIAPSKYWIRKNCTLTKEAERWLEKLPGPYTLILKLKNKEIITEKVNLGKDTIGIRIPNHWIHDIAVALNKPLITTSANVHGKQFMTTIEEIDKEIQHKTSFAIYEGPKKGSPSTIIDLTGNKKIVLRKQKLINRLVQKGKTIAQKVASLTSWLKKRSEQTTS